jgi:hypothetical protein
MNMLLSAACTPFRSSPMLTVGHSVLHSASPSTPAHQHNSTASSEVSAHSQLQQLHCPNRPSTGCWTDSCHHPPHTGQNGLANLCATPQAMAPARLC